MLLNAGRAFAIKNDMIDSHVHIFAPAIVRDRAHIQDPVFTALYGDPKAKMATGEDLLRYMDECEIERAVVCNMTWEDPSLARLNNEYILSFCSGHPERLYPMVTPPYLFSEKDAADLEGVLSSGAGIGEIRIPLSYLADPASPLTALTECVKKHHRVILLHASEPVGHLYPGKEKITPEVLEPFIKRCDATLVLAHFGGGMAFYALMKEVREYLINCYFDTAAGPFLYSSEIFEIMIRLVGADRIMLGTDYPLLKISRILREIDASALTDAERELITDKNARELFFR